MDVGKNKRISKGRKGGKKKCIDPFSKKDWYDVMVPSSFINRNDGKTLVSRTQGTKVHGDYSAEDVGVNVERPADGTMAEEPK